MQKSSYSLAVIVCVNAYVKTTILIPFDYHLNAIIFKLQMEES